MMEIQPVLPVPSPIPSLPLQYDCFLQEQAEAESYSALEISNEFEEACKEMTDIINKVLNIKLHKDDKNELRPIMMETALISMNMKKLNRLDKHCLKKSRDILSERKQKVDSLNLQLQNLQYQASYLQNEITSCLEFKSEIENIELVPLEEFLEENPEVISKPNMTEDEKHELMLVRLQWELNIRKSLAMKVKEAEFTIKRSKNNIKSLRRQSRSALPMLDRILQATIPIQKKLGIPLQENHFHNRNALFLPKPLYQLYVRILSYSETIDKTIRVSINGHADNVVQLGRYDSAEETEDSDEDDISRATYHRHISTRSAESSSVLFSTHPLSVVLTVTYKEHKISLKFHYLTFLELVTVCAINLHVDLPSSDNTALETFLSLESFFDYLFPDDCGQLSVLLPHTKHTLEFEKRTDLKSYIWCQKLAGLKLPLICNINEDELSSNDEVFVMEILPAIKSRLKARILLSLQISALVSHCKMPTEIASICEPKVISELKILSNVPWNRVLDHPNAEEFLDLKMLTKESFVFEAVIERGSASLTALIVITINYPAKSPLFLIFMHWKGDSTSASNFAVRELEQEINVHFVQDFPKEHSDMLLRCQLHHLRSCFDIYVETERFNEFVEGPQEFVKEKVVTSSYRKPGSTLMADTFSSIFLQHLSKLPLSCEQSINCVYIRNKMP